MDHFERTTTKMLETVEPMNTEADLKLIHLLLATVVSFVLANAQASSPSWLSFDSRAIHSTLAENGTDLSLVESLTSQISKEKLLALETEAASRVAANANDPRAKSDYAGLLLYAHGASAAE